MTTYIIEKLSVRGLFSLYLDNNPESFNEDSSEILFGGIDPQYSLEEFVKIPALNSHYWELIFNNILLLDNGKTTDSITLSATSAILDSGLSFILMTSNDLFDFKISLKSNFSLNCYNDINHNYACDCPNGNIDSFPQLTFAFGTTTLTLNPSYYLKIEEQACILLIIDGTEFTQVNSNTKAEDAADQSNINRSQSLSKTENTSYIVLGTPFLRAFYTVFDRDHSTVSFAKVHTPSSKRLTTLEIIYLTFGIFIIILFILLIIWVSRLWLRKNKSSRKDSRMLENVTVAKNSPDSLQNRLIIENVEKK